MPSNLWREAVRHSIYVLNRLPTRALSGITPYEAWNEKKPDLSHLRTFGCVAHIKIPSVHTTKLDDISKLVVYLGKEYGTKAWRLYDPDSGKIQVSRDVIFEENRAWSWEKTEGGSAETLNTFTVLGSSCNIEDTENSQDEAPATPTNQSAEYNATTSDASSGTEESSEPQRFVY